MNPEERVFVFQHGTDECEQAFGGVRTMTPGDRNADTLQLMERLIIASAELRHIFMRHPEWKNYARRRLRINDLIDHTSPHHWTGDLSAGSTSSSRAWNDGRTRAMAKLSHCSWYRALGDVSIEDTKITMMKPKGVIVGVREETKDESIDDEWDDDDDDEVTEVNEEVDLFEQYVVEDLSVKRYVNIGDDNSTPIHKATMVRELNTNGFTTLSADRLRRVRGYSKSPDILGPAESSTDEISEMIIGDPCAILVKNEKDKTTTTCLVIILIDTIDNSPNGKSVMGKIMKMEKTKDVDCLEWTRSVMEKAVSSKVFIPLNPNYDITKGILSFTGDSLINAYNLLQTGIIEEKRELTNTKTNDLPYPAIGSALSTEPSEVDKKNSTPNPSTRCRVCNLNIPNKQMRRHIGTHILMGQLPSTVCGFCGSEAGCESVLERSSGKGATKTLSMSSNCTLFVKFNYKSAEKSTRNGPCTNRLFYCSEPPCQSESMWSYHAETHYRATHPGTELPVIFAVSEEEKNLMLPKKKR